VTRLPHHTQDHPGGPVWIERGRTFGFDDIVHYKDKAATDFSDVAGRIDLVITGPHATGALPREVEPFLADGMTERIQYDFSDHTTGDLARSWANSDPRVVYIEYPHHRTMYDPNRPPPKDVAAELKEFWRLRRSEEGGAKVSYNGVDAVRPISFGGITFLREPATEGEWHQMAGLLGDVARQGALPYDAVKRRVIETIVEAKSRNLAALDITTTTVPEWASARHLHVICLHDTMNTTITESGAVNVDRPRGERLPRIVSLGNRGDFRGEPRPPTDGSKLPQRDVVTMAGAAIRSVQTALQMSFGVPGSGIQEALALNQPYLGAFEVQDLGRLLRRLQDEAVVRHSSDEGILRLTTGAYQAEFSRELLLGPRSTQVVQAPGVDWPDTDLDNIADIASRLASAYDLLRRWDYRLQPQSRYKPPVHR
jgi:hypothetical protein